MSVAYERVRAALAGTALEGEIDRLNADLHLTPESPEWTLAALGVIGGASLRTRLDDAEHVLRGLVADLPEAMRAASVPIVSGLASETKDAVVVGVRTDLRDDFKTVFTGVANLATAVVEEAEAKIEQISKATADLARQAEADSQETAGSYQHAALKIIEALSRVGGWTPFRISSTGLGAAAVLLAFILGWTSQYAHTSASELLGCHRNVAHAAGHLALSGHASNYLRSAICQGGS